MTGALAILLAAGLACGSERADVKHMSDEQAGAVNQIPQDTSIEDLVALQAPDPPIAGHEARGAQAAEFDSFMLEGTVFVAKREADQDVHLGLSDGNGHTMVVEVVDPRCAKHSIVRGELVQARIAVLRLAGGRAITQATLQHLVGKHLRISGVAFFDVHRPGHEPTGSAPNGIELHPVLSIEVLP